MTKQETTKAIELLQDRMDRVEVTGSETEGGFALTAYWLDGSGQKLFYTLDEVERHCADHHAIKLGPFGQRLDRPTLGAPAPFNI